MDFSLGGVLSPYKFTDQTITYVRSSQGQPYVIGLGHVLNKGGMEKSSLIPNTSPPAKPTRVRGRGIPAATLPVMPEYLKAEFSNVVESKLLDRAQAHQGSAGVADYVLLTEGYVSSSAISQSLYANTFIKMSVVGDGGGLLERMSLDEIAGFVVMVNEPLSETTLPYLEAVTALKKEEPILAIEPHEGITKMGLSMEEFKVAIQLPSELYSELYL